MKEVEGYLSFLTETGLVSRFVTQVHFVGLFQCPCWCLAQKVCPKSFREVRSKLDSVAAA
jgi:hypothetical protein